MSQLERHGVRGLEYSAWHRMASTMRFGLSRDEAAELSMVDIDCAYWIEYQNDGRTPVLLVETARDVGQGFKPATVLTNLARAAGIPALVVLYQLSTNSNPAAVDCADIEMFRVRRTTPRPMGGFVIMGPSEFARFLLDARHRRSDDFARNRVLQYVTGGAI